ncbi:MAG: InlB B-repeat-containing protein, partial [Acidimicrobiaceae bacterium]|nr:InlB B-repeat-containing protein [Acidimicrobiaceae bacterium]
MTKLLRLLLATVGFTFPFFGTISAEATSSQVHVVTFVANYFGTTATASESSAVAALLTPVSQLGPAFNPSTFGFSEWSTNPSGGGQIYQDSSSYNFSSDVTLYAQWMYPNVTVTFAENASPGDPVTASQTENKSSNLDSEASLVPSFTKPGWTFENWNTSPDGSGTPYLDGATYGFAAPLLLYAQWAPTISFDPNGGIG